MARVLCPQKSPVATLRMIACLHRTRRHVLYPQMDLRSIAAGEVLEDRRSGKTYLVEVVSVPSPDAWDERFADTDIMVRWNGAEPLPGLPAYLEKLYRPGDADAEEEAE